MPAYQDPKVPFVPDRTQLPIHEPTYPPITEMYAPEAKAPPRFTVTPPPGAPNVVIFLIDDMGFGCTSAFGGPVPMPTAERLAKRGQRFNRFHTTALCAPTRTALLSGYNHHMNNMGNITECGTSFPGNTSTRPKSVTPVARVLRENGYSTAHFGKCHETPVWELSVSGPFDHWPTFSGFDKFYGFLGAESNQYHPELFDGVTQLETPEDPDYHLSKDLADHCIEWMKLQKALTPDKPFFTYFAPGATHAPHHAPREYIEKFRGQFDEGWDVIRARTLENMKKLGVAPQDAKLAAKPEGIVDWDTLDDDHKKLFAHQMEVYAAFAHYTDEHIGRVVDAMEELSILDNTVIFYILGDNGASAEGNLSGCVNELSQINGPDALEPFDFVLSHMDKLGGDYAYNHYAAGWAVTMDAPFMWTKQVASNFGGTRNGMIFHYPAKFKGSGEVHTQFHHVIDVAPTILDLAGIPQPKFVDGVEQRPMEGISMKYAVQDARAADQRRTQYFCVGGNSGVYHEGWFAGVLDKAPWENAPRHPLEQPVWELYHVDEDFSMEDDVAAKFPDKLQEMIAVFKQEAEKYSVLPIDNRVYELFNAKIAGRPTLMGDRKEITLGYGMTGLKENCFLNTKNTSFSISANIEVEKGRTDGVLFCQGGRFGGYSLYVKDGIPCFCYNFVNRERYYVKAEKPLEPGTSTVLLEFKYDGGGLGKGGGLVLTVNGHQVTKGRVEHTMPFLYSMDETASVGMQRGTPVTEDYTAKDSKFQGNLYAVTIKVE